MPHRDNHWMRKQAPLLGLIALIVLIFILQILTGPFWYQSWMVVPAEVTAAWNQLLNGHLSADGIRTFATLLTAAFLHGGVEHVLFNMLFLWIFAALAAELLGHRWMLAIFVATAIAGSICHTMMNADEFVPMLGASGAVMGFQGLYLGLAIRWQLPDPHVWPMSRPIPPVRLGALAAIGVTMDFMGIMNHAQTHVAFGAHIGGFFAGLLMASFLTPKLGRD